MKRVLIVPTIVALMALTVTTALANHGAKLPASPMPAHGSVWFGDGMGYYQEMEAALIPPPHGSIWFGEGLARYHSVDATATMPVHGSVWFGKGL